MREGMEGVNVSAPHFRIVYPKDLRGTEHAGHAAQVFVTLPGMEEIPLPATTNIKAEWGVDGVVHVDISFVGTIEVEYT
jgi:hypothetical protein